MLVPAVHNDEGWLLPVRLPQTGFLKVAREKLRHCRLAHSDKNITMYHSHSAITRAHTLSSNILGLALLSFNPLKELLLYHCYFAHKKCSRKQVKRDYQVETHLPGKDV